MYTYFKIITIDSTHDFSTTEPIEYLYNELSTSINSSDLDFTVNYNSDNGRISIQDPLLDFDMGIQFSLSGSQKQVLIDYDSSVGCTGTRRLNIPYYSTSSSNIYVDIYICNTSYMKFLLITFNSSSISITNFVTLMNLEKYPSYGHLTDNSDISKLYDISYGLFKHGSSKLLRCSISGASDSYNRTLVGNTELTLPKEEFTTSLLELPIFDMDFSNTTNSAIHWINTVKNVYFSQQGNLNVGKIYSNDTNSYVAIFPDVLYKL